MSTYFMCMYIYIIYTCLHTLCVCTYILFIDTYMCIYGPGMMEQVREVMICRSDSSLPKSRSTRNARISRSVLTCCVGMMRMMCVVRADVDVACTRAPDLYSMCIYMPTYAHQDDVDVACKRALSPKP